MLLASLWHPKVQTNAAVIIYLVSSKALIWCELSEFELSIRLFVGQFAFPSYLH